MDGPVCGGGLIEAELPLDRARYEALLTAVLAWTDPHRTPRDYEQIALQLTGHARAVAADVRRHAAALPKNDGRVALAEVVLRAAGGRLSAPLEGTAGCAQNRARLVRVLYERLNQALNGHARVARGRTEIRTRPRPGRTDS
ncbi:restriction endonuclease [Streptomyces sp. NPDC003032]